MDKKQIFVTGANGQLGQSIAKIANQFQGYEIKSLTRDDLDIGDRGQMQQFFKNYHGAIIVNCAAYTAVDKAELEPVLANQVNHLGPKYLAEIAKDNDLSLIHISTDYVFDGKNSSAYKEDHPTKPMNQYGLSKWSGEQAIRDINPKGVIIRTSWVYSEFGNNFVKTMLKLAKQNKTVAVVSDQIGAPTYATDLALTIMAMISHPSFESLYSKDSTYHFNNEGSCSWYDFAKTIFAIQQIDNCEALAIETKDYPVSTPRPLFSLLDQTKIKQQFGVHIPHWEKSLRDCLQTIVI